MTQTESELRPCPFCGHQAEMNEAYKASVRVKNEEVHYQIKCTYCSAKTGWADDKQFLIVWWNGNYNPADLLRRLREAVEEIVTNVINREPEASKFAGHRSYEDGANMAVRVIRKHKLLEDK